MEIDNTMEVIVILVVAALFLLLFLLSLKAYKKSWDYVPSEVERLAIQEMSGAFIKLAVAQFNQRSMPVSKQKPEQMSVLLQQQDELVISYNRLLGEHEDSDYKNVSLLRIK